MTAPGGSSRRRLLVVSGRPLDPYAGGSVRWSHFARALPALGWDVSVVSAARYGRSSAPPAPEERPPPSAVRRALETADLLLRPVAERTGVRPVAFLTQPHWAITGRLAVHRAVSRRRPDAMLVTTPPFTAMFAAAAVAHRRGVPLVCEMRDLWAGNPDYDAGRGTLTWLEERVFDRARLVVTVTPEARERLAALHPRARDKLQVVPNGFSPDLLALRRTDRDHRDGRAVVVHAGSIYATRSIDGLVRALSRPGLRARVRFEMLGGINQRALDSIAAAPPDLERSVRGEVPRAEAIEAVRNADVVAVIFTPGDDTAVPGKLYEALVLGRPVLALTDRPGSAMERLLHQLGQDGGCARHDDPDAIASAIERLLDTPPAPVHPRELAQYDRAALTRQLAGLLAEVVDGR
ncbi:MAG: hypothetical protein QOF69_4113 [Solirubrobacteraceae bacterium]|nr:hypothetical protein [Solirubrobacteraceae bacterium]